MQINYKKAKPFVKWAGGKKQVIKFIDEYLPQSIKNSKVIDYYVEPFLGGGAVFFHLIKEYQINNVYLGDINKDLILTYKVVKDNPDELIVYLNDYSRIYLENNLEGRKKFYYNIRDDFNQNLIDFNYKNISDDQIMRASQMIFLNKTCFNGLYRVNKNGEFNVPIGRYKNPLICDEYNLLNVSKALNEIKNIKIVDSDFSLSENVIGRNSFVYLDPPYLPIKENSFTSYNSEGFGVKEQIKLSQFCKKIDEKGAKFILSNSDPKNTDPSCNFFKDIYGKLGLKICNHKKVDVRRSINSKGNKRGPIKELLIYNY